MNRKEFLKTLGVAGTALAVNGFGSLETFAQSEKKDGPVDLVAVIGGEPDVLLQKALAELGGIARFVQKGQKVVIKPNIGWDRKAELAANTNPILVGEMVKQCLAAGASEVSVLDHTCDRPQSCYTNSGIEKAVVDAGGKMLPANDERYYRDGDLPDGKKLKKSKFHHALLDCDVWFNLPVLKVHGGIALSMSMKNYMGIVYDRRIFHRIDLAQCIADVCTWSKKPALNIVDAYRVMTANGPKGLSEADCVVAKALIASPDIVAADTAAVKLAEQFTKIKVEDVEQIRAAEELQLGTSKLENLNVRRVRI